MWPFNRRPAAGRVHSLGEMIAYSLTSEVTRASWRRDGDELRNESLKVIVPRYVRDTITVRGRPVPLTDSDNAIVSRASGKWREWDDDCRRAEALVNFVEAFERVVEADAQGDKS